MRHYHHLCNEEWFYMWQTLRADIIQQQIARALDVTTNFAHP